MSLFDLLVVALAALAAFGGYRLGFVTRVTSWAGLVIGVGVALLALPIILDVLGVTEQFVVLVVVIGAAFFGATFGQAIGFFVGRALRPDPAGATSGMDRAAGAGAGIVGVLVVLWLLVPVLTGLPGGVSKGISESWVVSQMTERLPAPPDAVNALEAIVGEARFPDVFAGLEAPPELGPPPVESGITPAVAETAARSVVKVEGIACGKVQTGTGFVVADGFVVTNAHVVAGMTNPNLIRNDGRVVASQVIAFDADHDLALLASPGVDRPSLVLGAAEDGQVGGIFGHPLGEPLRIAPFQVSRSITATGRDIYGLNLVERRVVEVAAALQQGDSGSPLVAADGTVVGITFAVSQERPGVAYALASNEVREFLNRPVTEVAENGACIG